jgi:DNA mismatch repair protein MutL
MAQIFGSEMLEQLVDVADMAIWPQTVSEDGASSLPSDSADVIGHDAHGEPVTEGLGIFGFVSRPEVQKINRNSIFIFVNRRLIRDRLIQHAVTEAYRNMLPTNSYPVVLLFLDLPYREVDVNVHPSKTEVRFRRQSFVHDAVRDAIRRALGQRRPIPDFTRELKARPDARTAFAPGLGGLAAPVEPQPLPEGLGVDVDDLPSAFRLTPDLPAPAPQRLPFEHTAMPPAAPMETPPPFWVPETGAGCEPVDEAPPLLDDAAELGRLKALAQIRDSFIVAASPGGLWLIDQHAAHERVLFEQVSAQRLAGGIERQQLLMPLVIDLDPGRWARFAEIADELQAAGFDAEPFGSRTIAVKATPAGLPAEGVQKLLDELLETPEAEARGWTLEKIRTRIAATIACHAAIKVNMRLEPEKMDWLLAALARTRFPMTCPHGRPVVLRYSLHEIQRAFKRIR